MNYFLDKFPPDVETVVNKLIEDMTFADRTRLANMNEAALIKFHQSDVILKELQKRLQAGNTLKVVK